MIRIVARELFENVANLSLTLVTWLTNSLDLSAAHEEVLGILSDIGILKNGMLALDCDQI